MSVLPKITVFMPVYNGKEFLVESVGSIQAQTFTDFEFLIIDDGSKDGSWEYLSGIQDPRLRLIRHESNVGIRGTYNQGLREARGEYIAIMDQDDISNVRRLEVESSILDSNPNAGLCGSRMEVFGDAPVPSWVRFSGSNDLKVALLFENPICHPSVMLRASLLRERQLSYPEVPYAEEYALWISISESSALLNSDDVLIRYRTHSRQVSRGRNDIQSASITRLAAQQLGRLGIPFGGRELILQSTLGGAFVPVPRLESKLLKWKEILLRANGSRKIYDQATLERQLSERIPAAVARIEKQLSSMQLLRRIKWRVTGWQQYRNAGAEAHG